jgi:hypothetical protein
MTTQEEATAACGNLGGKTRVMYSEEWESKAVRDAYVEMQMVEGLDMTFDHLTELLWEWQT